ncbi:trypsin-like peptidase domain-containing protein [Hamadaea sp. NPDC050747]|uniref:S1C family serine protease n=1 Tax=Hamadaea sp. NPDC050747 TaxID=3155789 RepID=UPI00340DBF0D
MSDPQSNPEPADRQIPNPFAADASAERPATPEQPSAEQAATASPAAAPAGQPAYAPPTYSYQSNYPTAPQPAVSGVPASSGAPVGSYGPDPLRREGAPASGPVWMPPGSNLPPGSPFSPAPTPSKSRPFLKVVAGVAAAGVIALCSAVAGGVVGAAVVDKNPVSTTTVNAAPAIDRSSLADIAANVTPSVVSIKTGSGEGSGVVFTADGYIVTNNHVVATASGKTVTVSFSDGTKTTGTIVGTDARYDLAVVKVDKTGLTAAKFGKSTDVRVGDTVLAIGSPLGLEGSVTEGIISAKDRTITVQNSTMSGLLQTDAPINPGNSGGALVNTNGEVVGINSSIATDGSSEGNIGIGFAISSDRVSAVANQLIKGQKVDHPYLGVKASDNETGGAKLTEVVSGGAAEKAGLKAGDVVTRFGESVVNDADDLVNAVGSHNPGEQITVTYLRDGATKTTTVTLGSTS